jgi:hypothetical protein
MRVVLAIAIGVILAAASSAAFADSRTAAEAEFVKGKKLLKDGKTAEACAAFELSQKLDPQFGTQYNLALCFEKLGRVASAWILFRELAQRDGNATRKKDSARRSVDLEAQLTKLLITIDAPAAGLEILRDGVDVTQMVGIEDPVDPGRYHIVARAPGLASWEMDVEVSGAGATVTVEIPKLREPPEQRLEEPATEPGQLPEPVAEPVDAPDPASPMPARKKGAIVLGGAGGVALVVGLVYGAKARSSWADVQSLCGSDLVCPDQHLANAEQLVEDTRSAGNLSSVLVGAGAVAVAGAIWLWVTAPEPAADDRVGLQLAPQVGPSGVGLVAAGWF